MNAPLMTAVKMPAIEWRTPADLPVEAQARPYPTASLPATMRDAVRDIARHVNAPEVLAAQCVIAAVGYLAQTRVNAPHVSKPDGMPCSLFQLALADSGDRKSECYRLAFKTINEAERIARDKYAAEAAEFRSMQEGLNPKALKAFLASHTAPFNPRTLYTDSTFEKIAGDFIKGMPSGAWFTDEGGSILGGHSMKADTVTATLGGLVKLFDNGQAERDRMGADAVVGIAYDRRFSVHMMAQEPTVREALNNPLLQGQGFLPRFLMSAAPSLAGTRFISVDSLKTNAYQSAAVQRFWARCKEIALLESFAAIDGAVTPPVIELTDEAQEVWIDFYNRIEGEQESLGEYGGALKPFASRSGELARRLAAGFALFDGESTISAKTMTAACEVAGHSLGEWARYLGSNAAESNGNREALELLGWLAAHAEARTVTSVLKGGPRKFRSAAKARNALSTLTAVGWLAFPGGNQQAFEVNPNSLSRDVANVANTAKAQVNTGFAGGEWMANAGELAANQTGGQCPAVEIRHDSPLIRHVETQQNRGFSPDSPDSPQLEPVNNAFDDFEEF
jgi:uncharacterized protein YbjQ (UPF0145 family)